MMVQAEHDFGFVLYHSTDLHLINPSKAGSMSMSLDVIFASTVQCSLSETVNLSSSSIYPLNPCVVQPLGEIISSQTRASVLFLPIQERSDTFVGHYQKSIS